MRRLILAVCCCLLAAGEVLAAGQLLPNAQQTFTGPNGVPLSGGFVFTYLPSTTTPKLTWQDSALSVPNSNPVQLDANGQARIWTTPEQVYRQVVLDANSNLIWDQLTATAGGVSGPTGSIAGDLVTFKDSTGRLLDDSGVTLATIDPITPQKYGAKCDGVADDNVALVTWFSAVKAAGHGHIPAGICKSNTALVWNLTSVATTGISISGDGPQVSILDLSGAGAPALTISGDGGADLFYSSFTKFGVMASVPDAALRAGRQDFTDALNSFQFDLTVRNLSTSASAIGIEFNNVLNSRGYMVVNNGGHGDSVLCRQCIMNDFGGSYSTADKGLRFTTGYSYGNVWRALDIENVTVAVVSDIVTASNQLFLGGNFVWSGTPAVTINDGSNNFRFILTQFGSGPPAVSGAKATVVQIDALQVGTFNFEAINLAPLTAKDADYVADALAGQTRGLLMKRGGLNRWFINGDNSANPGADVGTNLNFARFHDAGTAFDNPLSIARDTGIGTFSLGLATSVGSKVGLFGAVPIVQPTNTGDQAQAGAGSVNAMFQDTRFTGGIGATGYSAGEIVAALKNLGLLAP